MSEVLQTSNYWIGFVMGLTVTLVACLALYQSISDWHTEYLQNQNKGLKDANKTLEKRIKHLTQLEYGYLADLEELGSKYIKTAKEVDRLRDAHNEINLEAEREVQE